MSKQALCSTIDHLLKTRFFNRVDNPYRHILSQLSVTFAWLVSNQFTLTKRIIMTFNEVYLILVIYSTGKEAVALIGPFPK